MIAAVAIAAAAIFDWTRPPRDQFSVRAFDIAVIGSYRAVFRPVTSRVTRCPFEPTCSHYAEEAMNTRGFPEGFFLTLWRLMRCGPWIRMGTSDPVPHT